MEALHIVQADYQALIQQKLAFIPADYLAHLYQIVSLMALPFEPVVEPIPEPIVTAEELEQYATYFKQAITTVLPTYTNVSINYQIIDNELVLIEVIPTEEAVSEKITAISLDIDLLFAENETTKEQLLQNITNQTMLLFSEEGVILCKQNLPAQWTQESAQADVRAVIGTLINHLPTYELA